MEKQRLDKIIASTGRWSRREVKNLVRQGRVLVDGIPARSAEEKADPEKGDSEEVDIKDVLEQEQEKAEQDPEYENAGRSYGIDVSKHQKTINWTEVGKSGIEFVMIRVGYRGNTVAASKWILILSKTSRAP